MSLSRPVLIKVRTLSICFIIVELTSTDSMDPRDEEVRGETSTGRGRADERQSDGREVGWHSIESVTSLFW